ncbi:Hypothetical predicted protein [Pelobates cultripes]|uniref:Uncharacterized protein n=1 Tax=Pelobates cultripes TaxID=61616 RepID=A0AAD1VZ16_PELCU|nr:Hypothetical predicted protein [Pelobates cultripes]
MAALMGVKAKGALAVYANMDWLLLTFDHIWMLQKRRHENPLRQTVLRHPLSLCVDRNSPPLCRGGLPHHQHSLPGLEASEFSHQDDIPFMGDILNDKPLINDIRILGCEALVDLIANVDKVLKIVSNIVGDLAEQKA